MPATQTARKAAATPKRLILTVEGMNVGEASTLHTKAVNTQFID